MVKVSWYLPVWTLQPNCYLSRINSLKHFLLNSFLTNNFLKYLRSTFCDDIDSNCFEVNVHGCESKLDIPDRLSDVVSKRSLKVIRAKILIELS